MTLVSLYHKLMHNKNWEKFIKHESNRSQTEKRIRDGIIIRTEVLSNLAELLPEYMQKEVYTSKSIERLIKKILNIRNSFTEREYPIDLDARRCQLASKMAELGTRFCISQYELMFSEHSALANPTIKHLKEAIAICQDIGNKIERDEQKIYAENKNLEYLFNWNYVTTRDINRFENFVSEVVGLRTSLGLLTIKDKGPQSLSCSVGDKELGINMDVEIKLDIIGSSGIVIIKNMKNLKPINLRLVKDGENIHIYRNMLKK